MKTILKVATAAQREAAGAARGAAPRPSAPSGAAGRDNGSSSGDQHVKKAFLTAFILLAAGFLVGIATSLIAPEPAANAGFDKLEHQIHLGEEEPA